MSQPVPASQQPEQASWQPDPTSEQPQSPCYFEFSSLNTLREKALLSYSPGSLKLDSKRKQLQLVEALLSHKSIHFDSEAVNLLAASAFAYEIIESHQPNWKQLNAATSLVDDK